MSRSVIPRPILYASLSLLLLSSACQGDHPTSPSGESTQQALTAASAAPADPQQPESALPSTSKSSPARPVVDLAPSNKVASYPPQNARLIRYQSPFETGRYNVTKQKGSKAFVASPPQAVANPIDGSEHRRRVDQYLAQWEQQKSQYSSLSAEEQEVARGQLKRRVLGE